MSDKLSLPIIGLIDASDKLKFVEHRRTVKNDSRRVAIPCQRRNAMILAATML